MRSRTLSPQSKQREEEGKTSPVPTRKPETWKQIFGPTWRGLVDMIKASPGEKPKKSSSSTARSLACSTCLGLLCLALMPFFLHQLHWLSDSKAATPLRPDSEAFSLEGDQALVEALQATSHPHGTDGAARDIVSQLVGYGEHGMHIPVKRPREIVIDLEDSKEISGEADTGLRQLEERMEALGFSNIALTKDTQEPISAAAGGTTEVDVRLWGKPEGEEYRPCIEPTRAYQDNTRNWTRGFLTAHANGGLNQMRAGICDMVAVARILNATLVIPDLDKSSFWNDSSSFSDLFDVDHFIESLKGDVPVVRHLPEDYKYAPTKRQHLRSWSPFKYYNEDIGALWHEYKVIRALKTDSRLSNNLVPPDIQKLRCRAQYKALRFAPRIEALGKVLVERMRLNGPFIALHLRYEADMLAYTGCAQGFTKEEEEELVRIRMAAKQWRDKTIDPAAQRAKGLCPLAPREVGLFLSALGYPNQTRMYVASGEIYGGERKMDELRRYFPLIERKETLATAEELEPLRRHQSALAALDFLVSVASDVFVASYSGNMARAVEGHRRFLGHRKTITPDRKGLVPLFDDLEHGTMQSVEAFSQRVAALHRNRMGNPRRRVVAPKGTHRRDVAHLEESFYSNPLPGCMCLEKSPSVELKENK